MITIRPVTTGCTITISGDPSLPTDAAVDAEWARLREAGPRLHDGPILLVEPGLCARRATYRTLATAAALGRNVRALGVQGLVIGRDRSGRTHLLLGRRSGQTRLYGGLWENAPSGTVAGAAPDAPAITLADLAECLRREGLEELGIDLVDSEVNWVATLEDPTAMSIDAVLEVRPRAAIDPRAAPCARAEAGRWEYLDAAWIDLEDLGPWLNRNAAAVSPPTLALLRWAGLVATSQSPRPSA